MATGPVLQVPGTTSGQVEVDGRRSRLPGVPNRAFEPRVASPCAPSPETLTSTSPPSPRSRCLLSAHCSAFPALAGRDELLGFAVTFDLALFIPAAFWLLVVGRRAAQPSAAVAVFLLASVLHPASCHRAARSGRGA